MIYHCAIRGLYFNQRPNFPAGLSLKIVFPKIFSHILFSSFYVVAAMQHVMDKLRHLFVRPSEHLGLKPLTVNAWKTFKTSAIKDHILLKCHDANFVCVVRKCFLWEVKHYL